MRPELALLRADAALWRDPSVDPSPPFSRASESGDPVILLDVGDSWARVLHPAHGIVWVYHLNVSIVRWLVLPA